MAGTQFGPPVQIEDLVLSVKLIVTHDEDGQIEVMATTQPPMNNTVSWDRWLEGVGENYSVTIADGTYEFTFRNHSLSVQDMPIKVGEQGRHLIQTAAHKALHPEYMWLIQTLGNFPTEEAMREVLLDMLEHCLGCTMGAVMDGGLELTGDLTLVTVEPCKSSAEFGRVLHNELVTLTSGIGVVVGNALLGMRCNEDRTHTIQVAMPGAGLYSDWLTDELTTQVQALVSELLPAVKQKLTTEITEQRNRLSDLLERIRAAFGTT